MICGHCGAENSEGTTFCKSCGKPFNDSTINTVNETSGERRQEESAQTQSKSWDTAKYLTWSQYAIIGIAALVVVALILSLSLGKKVNTPTIDLNQYLTIEAHGYNGQGEVEATVDWDAISEEYGDALRYTTQSKEEFGNSLNLISPVEMLRDAVSIEMWEGNNLSNGEKVGYGWNINEDIYKYVDVVLQYSNSQNDEDAYTVAGLEIDYDVNLKTSETKDFDDKDYTVIESNPDEVDRLAVNSPITISNVLDDGSFWAYDDSDRSKVRADINGNVYFRIPAEANNVVRGLSDTLYGMYNNLDQKYEIWTTDTGENITDIYVGDYDEIVKELETENGYIFVVAKFIENYMEEYLEYKLVDSSGKEFYRISLDSENLMTKYGIEKDYSPRHAADVLVHYVGNGVYCIGTLGKGYSIIVDTNRNKEYPVVFDAYNNNISSDGNFTLMCDEDFIILNDDYIMNNEDGQIKIIKDSEYFYKAINGGEIKDGKFFVTRISSHRPDSDYIMDSQGNIKIDLNNYGKKVRGGKVIFDGKIAALIELENGYITLINDEGNFLFDPIKTDGVYKYYEKAKCVLFKKDRAFYYLNENGEVKPITITVDEDDLIWGLPFYVTKYEDNIFWLTGGRGGIQVQKIE